MTEKSTHKELRERVEKLSEEVSKRQWAEEALKEQVHRNEQILQTAMDGFCMVDINGRFLKVNRAVAGITGYSVEEMLTMNIRDVDLQLASVGDFRRNTKRMRRKGFDRFETKMRHKDGRILDLEVSTNYIEMGEERFFFSFVRDISERKGIESKLKVREVELEKKNRSLEEINTALKVLLRRRDEDKNELEERVVSNVKELVVPYLQKLRKTQLDTNQMANVDVLEANLNNIVSPFIEKLSSRLLALTPTEIRIADLIRHGQTSKTIASFLNVSPDAIMFHRKNIRRKLGLTHEKTNLRSYLQTFSR